MGRRSAVVLGALVFVSASIESALAGNPGPFPLVAAGNPIIAVVNTNNNNSLTDPQDCKIMAEVDSDAAMGQSGVLTVTAVQDADENTSLQYCDETYTGPAFLSSGMAEMNLSRAPGNGTQQSIITLLQSLSSGSATPFAIGGAAGDPPLTLGAAILRDMLGNDRGEGFLCDAGGPALQIRTDSGVRMIFNLEPFPSSENRTHMCAPGVPVEIGFGQFANNDICFPVDANGNTPIALQQSPDQPFIQIILFDSLPSCSLGRQAAPSASELGLMLLALSLLGSGVWLLSRRQTFAASLPRL